VNKQISPGEKTGEGLGGVGAGVRRDLVGGGYDNTPLRYSGVGFNID